MAVAEERGRLLFFSTAVAGMRGRKIFEDCCRGGRQRQGEAASLENNVLTLKLSMSKASSILRH